MHSLLKGRSWRKKRRINILACPITQVVTDNTQIIMHLEWKAPLVVEVLVLFYIINTSPIPKVKIETGRRSFSIFEIMHTLWGFPFEDGSTAIWIRRRLCEIPRTRWKCFIATQKAGFKVTADRVNCQL